MFEKICKLGDLLFIDRSAFNYRCTYYWTVMIAAVLAGVFLTCALSVALLLACNLIEMLFFLILGHAYSDAFQKLYTESNSSLEMAQILALAAAMIVLRLTVKISSTKASKFIEYTLDRFCKKI